MNFELKWKVSTTIYVMQVRCTVANDSIEEFEVRAGEKIIVFRCNRPELKRTGKKQRIKWQLVSKNFPLTKNIELSAQLMLDLQDQLEDYIEPRPSFQQTRTKIITSGNIDE